MIRWCGAVAAAAVLAAGIPAAGVAPAPAPVPLPVPAQVELREEPRAPREEPALDDASLPVLPLSLDLAVQWAVERNEAVLVAEAEQARTAGLVREVAAGAYPSLTASGVYTRNVERPVFFFNTPEGLQRIEVGSDNEVDLAARLRQTLFDPALGPAIRAARLARGAAAAGTERARTLMAFEARLAYFDTILAHDLVRVREQAVAQAETRLGQVRAFHDAGTAAEFDLLTAQVEVANLRPPLIEARNLRDLALARLKRVVGLPLDREVELTDGFLRPEAPGVGEEVEAAVAAAFAGRSDLETQRLVIELQEEGLAVERRSAYPTLDLTADYLRRASTDDFPQDDDFVDSLAAGLLFEVDLFDGGERKGRVAQAEAVLDRERRRYDQLAEEIRLEVEEAVLALRAARESVEASRGTVAQAEKALEIAQLRFRNGLSTQVELDDAELALTEARTNLARSLHAYSTARAALQAAQGER